MTKRSNLVVCPLCMKWICRITPAVAAQGVQESLQGLLKSYPNLRVPSVQFLSDSHMVQEVSQRLNGLGHLFPEDNREVIVIDDH
jgi:hypothetical protein